MLTVEEVAAIPLFSALPVADLERLARTSADLQLSAGEFAVHEGGEGALFVVISGKIEVIKTFDGIERTLGWRIPGAIFGEVPITLGTPFPGGYRAAEPSRVMRMEVQQYYAIAAVSKDVAQKINALARERLGGLQAITSEPHKPRVTLIGHRWDTGCADLRRFLARNQISFDWVTSDAPEAMAFLDAALRPAIDDAAGKPPQRNPPVARLADGTIIENPEVRDLASRLGLQTSPRGTEFDVAIVGGGPAGLAAAVYGASEGLRTIVVEQRHPADRPERRRESRITSAFRAAYPATSLQVVPFSRLGGWGRKFWSRVLSRASIQRSTKSSSTGAMLSGRAALFLQRA